jgi:hypothetical protein
MNWKFETMNLIILAAYTICLLSSTIITKAYLLNSTNCPQFCICELTINALTINCNRAQTSPALFSLPNVNLDANLLSVSYISARNAFLQRMPNNICQYPNLQTLDLSCNSISDSLEPGFFNCINRLACFNITNNLIYGLNESAFDQLNSLVKIDLSYNRIASIPINLFYYKVPNLQYLYMQNNLISELDPWYFFLKRIKVIDLSFNKISRFTNNIGWYIYSKSFYPQLPLMDILDLRYNRIVHFDDSLLRLYSVCNYTKANFFLHLLYRVRIDQNPLICSCQGSYNLLKYTQSLYRDGAISLDENLFMARCASPPEYASSSIFFFVVPTIACYNPSLEFPNGCDEFSTTKDSTLSPSATSTTTTSSTTTTTVTATMSMSTTTNQNNTITISTTSQGTGANPQQLLNERGGLTGAQIAGIVIGLLGALFLLLMLMFCLCPVEILALLFGCSPCFYSCCPCKSGDKTTKTYDVFVSYNRSSEQWIKKTLVPYFQLERPIDKYALHYGIDNPNGNVFNESIRAKMSDSAVILLVLSDAYLMNEWKNNELRTHIRNLVTNPVKYENTRLVCIQLHDVSDEEVDEYVRQKLQVPRVVSLENDEILFWKKLSYILHTRRLKKDKSSDLNYLSDRQQIITPVNNNIRSKANDDLIFSLHNISRPIIHFKGKKDPYAVDRSIDNLNESRGQRNSAFEPDYIDKPRSKKERKNNRSGKSNNSRKVLIDAENGRTANQESNTEPSASKSPFYYTTLYDNECTRPSGSNRKNLEANPRSFISSLSVADETTITYDIDPAQGNSINSINEISESILRFNSYKDYIPRIDLSNRQKDLRKTNKNANSSVHSFNHEYSIRAAPDNIQFAKPEYSLTSPKLVRSTAIININQNPKKTNILAEESDI